MSRNSAISRADLIHCFVHLGEQRLGEMAELFGYSVATEPARTQRLRPSSEPEPLPSAPPPTYPAVTRSLAGAGVKFYRVVQQTTHTPDYTADNPPEWFQQARALTQADLQTSFALPQPLPLVRWSRLWPLLRTVLASEQRLGKADIRQLVRRTAEGEIVTVLPRLKRPGWALNCQIIGDFSHTLLPFWDDFHWMVKDLRRLRGAQGLQALMLMDGDTDFSRDWFNLDAVEQPWVLPTAGTPLVIMSDLGCLDPSAHRRQQWQNWGQRLQTAGLKPIVLMPCPRRLWDIDTVRWFTPLVWDYSEHYPRSLPKQQIWPDALPKQALDYEHGAGTLLTLLAATYLIEPALLRAVRSLLTPDQADVASEAAVWRHQDLLSTPDWLLWKSPAASPHPDSDITGQRYLKFRQQTHLPRQAAADVVKVYHRWLSLWVQHEEQCNYAGLLDQPPSAESLDYFSNAAKSLTENELLHRWGGDYVERLRPWVWQQSDELKSVFQAMQFKIQERWVAHGQEIQVSLNGLDDTTQGAWMASDRHKPRTWILSQKQGQLSFELAHSNEYVVAVNGFSTAWSRVTEVVAAQPLLEFSLSSETDEQTAIYRTKIGTEVGALLSPQKGQRLVLTTDHQTVTVDHLSKPQWAKQIGHDVYGLWAEFEIEGIIQRLRWINPGTFLMGSPEDEPERQDNEPQHPVTLTQGYWLADTACTQALWEAVMDNNSSQSNQGGSYPVERVSWDDVQIFIQRLNDKIPDLDVRLPIEAEWEYACRAGTQTPFSFGKNITPEQVNYDGDNPYPGGKKGEYRGKTVEVTALPENKWGLYQMHGNVWEWCADWYGEYPNESVTDPVGSTAGVDRVLRGGSWVNNARYARSAYRIRNDPSYRDDDCGFRLARGPKEKKPAGE